MTEPNDDADSAGSTEPTRSRARMPSWTWGAIAPLLSLLAFRDALSSSRVLYLRDLSFYFWGEHLWLRDALLRGDYPLWDPYCAFGQSAIADPNRGLLFPPTLLLRLAFPTALGFNLCVVMAFVVCALGMYRFLRRYVSPQAAALAASTFVLSGPSLSMANFINFPWAFAFVPWVLFFVDLLVERPSRRRFAGLALAFSMVFLAGEAATLVSIAALSLAYAFCGAGAERRLASRLRSVVLVGTAGLTGLLIGAAQAFPLAETIGRSIRAPGANERLLFTWSLHPLMLLEGVLPQIFGDPTLPFGGGGDLLRAISSGREPLMYSIYVGVGAIGLGVIGAMLSRARRQSLFWSCVAIAWLTCALGRYSLIYQVARRVLPLLASVRYPSKYATFVAFAIAVLAGLGWDAVATGLAQERQRRLRASLIPAAVIGIGALAFAVWAFTGSGSLEAASAALAGSLGAVSPQDVAEFIVRTAPLACLRLAVLAGATVGCVWITTATSDRRALGFLFAIVIVDVFLSTQSLIPTMPARLLEEPSWVATVHEHPESRVYVAGRLAVTQLNGSRVDPPTDKPLPVTENAPEAEVAALHGFLVTFPGAWRVRDAVSYDNSVLHPREYWDLLDALNRSSLDERARFLQRAGVRYFIVPWDDWGDGTLRRTFDDRPPLRLYERDPLPRAFVVGRSQLVADEAECLERLMSADFDASAEVLLDQDPPATEEGSSPDSESASATIVDDGTSSVVVDASVDASGGYLVLLDTFNPDWTVTVDGVSTRMLRANELFRAVRLGSGRHRVVFTYRPKAFWQGLAVSGATLSFLLLLTVVPGRRKME